MTFSGADVAFDTKHNHDLKRVSDTFTSAQEITSEQNNSGTECSETDDKDIEQVASVQTRAIVEKEKRPVKPLKVTTISGLDIGRRT